MVPVPVQVQTQPATCKVTVQSILMFPFRLCNPPPAVGKVRSCGVTPILDVRLADILDRRHLPPLGLKDFEEWLLYVEHCPENLYFILWLREYTVRYRQWQVTTATRRRETPQYLGVWPSHNSSQLAMFYARAKQTFLTPNANHELNLPSDILAPFHTSNGSPHPDPAVFNRVAVETQNMLNESLQRFVAAQVNNVGNKRVMCGLVAGVVCCLVGALLPLLYIIIRGGSRWSRLAALPGLWMGVTLLLTSLNGICLAVYVFGDLRQLRKFELSRPPISRPQPLYSSRRYPAVPRSATPPRESRSAVSISSSFDSSCEIQISPAYYETDPIEGPAISPISCSSSMEKDRSGFDDYDSADEEYPTTALFIHPFIDPGSSEDVSDNDSTFPAPKNKPLPEELQPISRFDFDSLPAPVRRPSQQPPVVSIPVTPHSDVDEGLSPKAIIRRVQNKCASIKTWLVVEDKGSKIQRQFKKVKSVPAFASPLTRVLSPVVVRGQWEIVIRSMVISLLVSWLLIGSLLAVPIIR